MSPSKRATWSKGNDSLEVNSDSHLDDCTSSLNDHDSVGAHALNEEL